MPADYDGPDEPPVRLFLQLGKLFDEMVAEAIAAHERQHHSLNPATDNRPQTSTHTS